MPWDQLLGPLALTAGSLIAVVALWKLVGDYITELRTSRDRWRDLAVSYESKFDQQTEALRVLPTVVSTLERIERRMESH